MPPPNFHEKIQVDVSYQTLFLVLSRASDLVLMRPADPSSQLSSSDSHRPVY